MGRYNRQNIATDTLQCLEQGYFNSPTGETINIKETQDFAVANTITYSPAMTDELLQNRSSKTLETPTEIEVTNETSLNATRRLINEGHTDVVCLNFASARNAGGGFLGGSQAQEESIARATGLYPSLMQASDYYEINRKFKSCFYTDYMIYSPKVPILKDEEGNCLEALVTASFITAPAVNTGIVKQREPKRLKKIEEVMKRRIEKVLAIALEHGHKSIILGAWGCGVFQNNPDDIARYFKEVIEGKFKNQFRKITFAIYASNERFIKPFQEAFA
ncbi:MAG: TIGR02452 family protein [Chitinophagales bacterium]